MDGFMNKVLGKCVSYLTKYVDKHWVALLIGLGIVVFVFLLILILSMTTGDFVRAKKACKLKAQGKHDDASKKLEKVRGAKAFSFDTIIYAPYAYSRLRTFKQIMLIASIFAALVAGMLSTTIDGIFSTDGAVNVVIVALIGFLLTLLAAILTQVFYKGAVKAYYKAVKIDEAAPIKAAANDDDLLPSTVALWEKINEASVKRENSLETLNILYSLLKEESNKPQSNANREKLKESRDILDALIEEFAS